MCYDVIDNKNGNIKYQKGVKELKKNLKIRQTAKDIGVHHWEIADALGISESLFCRRLRHELSETEQMHILDAIANIASKRKDEQSC